MLLLNDCKYQLISEYRVPRNEKAKVECSPKKTADDNEAVEDGLLSTSIQTAKQEFVNLLTEEEINKVQYSQRHSVINHHCDRRINHLGVLDISFVLLNISSKFPLHLECYLVSPKRHIKISI